MVEIAEPGFEIVDGVVPAPACDALAAGLASTSRAGARHLMSLPVAAEFARSEPMLAIARRHLGNGAVPFRATLFEKSGEKNWLVYWHQDTALPLASRHDATEWGPWSSKGGVLYAHAPAWALRRVVALRLHLDASTEHNGPLRVVPGTQELGVLSDDEVFRISRERPAETCPAAKGAVLVMRPLLIHASSKAESPEPRRVLHIEYADRLDLASGLRLALA